MKKTMSEPPDDDSHTIFDEPEVTGQTPILLPMYTSLVICSCTFVCVIFTGGMSVKDKFKSSCKILSRKSKSRKGKKNINNSEVFCLCVCVYMYIYFFYINRIPHLGSCNDHCSNPHLIKEMSKKIWTLSTL